VEAILQGLVFGVDTFGHNKNKASFLTNKKTRN